MHCLVEVFLALRYLRPKRNFVSVITVLSLLGVMFGVGVLIVVLAVMEGFEKELDEKIVGFTAHVTVTSGSVIYDWPEIKKKIEQDPEVVAATPLLGGAVLAQIGNRITTPYIKGVDEDSSENVVPMKSFLVAGEWLTGPDSVLVGQAWAEEYEAVIGDTLFIQSPKNMRNMIPPKPGEKDERSYYLPSEYKIVGIFSTGYYEYDLNFVLLKINEAQRLFGLDDGIHGFSVRIKNPFRAVEVKKRLNGELQAPLRAQTWIDQNKVRYAAIANERRMMSFILFFVMIVAGFGLTSTLITVTVQKGREIGLLKALGAQDRQILAIFTLYGFLVGVGGAILGVLGGMAVLAYRNDFSSFLARNFNADMFPAEIYMFSSIPAVTDPWTVTTIAFAGVALSTLAALLPAISAMRIDPVKVLHGE